MSVIRNTPPVLISRDDLDEWVKESMNTTGAKKNPIIGNIFSRIWNMITGNLSAIKVVRDKDFSKIDLVYVRKDALASLLNQPPRDEADFKALIKNAVTDIALKGKTILRVKEKLGFNTTPEQRPEDYFDRKSGDGKPDFTEQDISVLRSVLTSNGIHGMGELFHPQSASRGELLGYISKYMPEENTSENDFVKTLRALIKSAEQAKIRK